MLNLNKNLLFIKNNLHKNNYHKSYIYLNPTSFSVSLTLFSKTKVFYYNLILSYTSFATYYFKNVVSSYSIAVNFLKSLPNLTVSSITNLLTSVEPSLFKCPKVTISFLIFYKSFLD